MEAITIRKEPGPGGAAGCDSSQLYTHGVRVGGPLPDTGEIGTRMFSRPVQFKVYLMTCNLYVSSHTVARVRSGMTPEEIVRQFCALVSKRDVEALRPLLDSEIVYHNIGMPASKGIELTLANISDQWEMFPATYDWEIRNLSADGDTVLTERIDPVGPAGVTAPVPVMGVFEIHNGKIRHWRDYFDSALASKMFTGEDTSELVS